MLPFPVVVCVKEFSTCEINLFLKKIYSLWGIGLSRIILTWSWKKSLVSRVFCQSGIIEADFPLWESMERVWSVFLIIAMTFVVYFFYISANGIYRKFYFSFSSTSQTIFVTDKWSIFFNFLNGWYSRKSFKKVIRSLILDHSQYIFLRNFEMSTLPLLISWFISKMSDFLFYLQQEAFTILDILLHI